jgi:hypothetical protein
MQTFISKKDNWFFWTSEGYKEPPPPPPEDLEPMLSTYRDGWTYAEFNNRIIKYMRWNMSGILYSDWDGAAWGSIRSIIDDEAEHFSRTMYGCGKPIDPVEHRCFL